MIEPATRARADRLTRLLAREHEALADFVAELATFDKDLLWKEYGYTSLYDFLTRELRCSNGTAYLRQAAARLVEGYPEVLDALRDGRLCISVVGQLTQVLTDENRAVVLPRFYNRSKRDAQVLRAELNPDEAPPARAVVTAVSTPAAPRAPEPATRNRSGEDDGWHRGSRPVGNSEPTALPGPRSEVEPVTADLRRLHLTVRQQLLDKVKEAQALRSHRHPGESLEATLEAAVELLLAEERKKKALVESPRPAPPPREKPEPGRRDARHIPAAVKREVWTRDQGRCQHRLESGELCGSTHQVEFHHLSNWADGGVATVAELSLRCHRHNQALAERDFGDGLIEHCRGRQRTARREGAQASLWLGG